MTTRSMKKRAPADPTAQVAVAAAQVAAAPTKAAKITVLQTWVNRWLENIGGQESARGYTDTRAFLDWSANQQVPKYLIPKLRKTLREDYGSAWESLVPIKRGQLTEEEKAARRARRAQLYQERLAAFPDYDFFKYNNVKVRGVVPEGFPHAGSRRSSKDFGNASLKRFLRKNMGRLVQEWRAKNPNKILVHGIY